MNVLKKPYTQLQRADFVCLNCYKKHLKLFETETALYAIKENEIVINDEIVEDANFEENQKKKRKEFARQIFLETSKVEQILYKACGLDFEDIILFLKDNVKTNDENPEIDLKALKIELRSYRIKRDNEYLEKMLKMIGYNDDDIDELFLSKKLRAINVRNG